jgi:copper homeostasis protein CutC
MGRYHMQWIIILWCVHKFLTCSTVNAEQTRQLAHVAHPLEVTFHRAIDQSNDCLEALKVIQSIPGVTRVLTSGMSLHGSRAGTNC